MLKLSIFKVLPYKNYFFLFLIDFYVINYQYFVNLFFFIINDRTSDKFKLFFFFLKKTVYFFTIINENSTFILEKQDETS